MKKNSLRDLSLFLWFLLACLGCFSFGIVWGTHPYRLAFLTDASAEAIQDIGIRQKNVMLGLSAASFVLALLNVGLAVYLWRRAKKTPLPPA